MTIYNPNLTAGADADWGSVTVSNTAGLGHVWPQTVTGRLSEEADPYGSMYEQANEMRVTAQRKCVRVKRMRAVSDAYKEATCETLISDTEIAIKVLARITQKAQEEKYRMQVTSNTVVRSHIPVWQQAAILPKRGV